MLTEINSQLESLMQPTVDDKKYNVEVELITGHRLTLHEYKVRRHGDCFTFTYDKPFDEVIVPVVKIVYLVKKEPTEKA
jgi:hypothetical protein